MLARILIQFSIFIITYLTFVIEDQIFFPKKLIEKYRIKESSLINKIFLNKNKPRIRLVVYPVIISLIVLFILIGMFIYEQVSNTTFNSKVIMIIILSNLFLMGIYRLYLEFYLCKKYITVEEKKNIDIMEKLVKSTLKNPKEDIKPSMFDKEKE